jgi:NitT/TauT family transport system substrate-binding protein
MKHALARVLAVALCAAALVVPSGARAQQTATIKVALPPAMDVAPALYADQAGLFSKAGLSVTITQMRSGAAISAAVAGGSINVGLSSLQALISGHARGVPFQLIAAGGVYNNEDPYAYLLVRKDSPIKSARDLAGKTLGAPALKDLDTVSSSAWIDQNGGDSKSVKFIELPNPALTPALLDGRIDAFTVGEPWNLIALDTGKIRVLGKSFGAIAPRFVMTAYFTSTDWANKNRDALEKFERALADATTYLNGHHDEAVKILAQFTKLNPSLLNRAVKGEDASYLDPKLVQPMIDVSAKYGVIEKPFPAQELISPYALKAAK